MRYLFGFMCVCALGVMPLVGCSETAGDGGSGGFAGSGGMAGAGGTGGTGGGDVSAYAAEELWLCRPDLSSNQCALVDLDTTEVRVDGTLVEVSGPAMNPDAKVDCFYIYHTRNQSLTPGNTETLSPTDPELLAALSWTGSHFRGVCRVFAPLYHQMSIGTYFEFWPFWEDTEFFQRAYDDVVEAFEYYMRAHNDGRDFVLLGDSQGSHMLKRLLQDKFDNDEALRGQLLSALLIGPTGTVHVPNGEQVGGSFANIPLCTSATATGCVIAFDAIAAGVPGFPDTATLSPPGMVRACVNPASFDSGPGTMAALSYPRSRRAFPFPDTVDTEWVSYPNIYESQCSEDGTRGYALEIDLVSQDPREEPFTPQELQAAIPNVGGVRGTDLHTSEAFIVMTDIVRIVEQQIASRDN